LILFMKNQRIYSVNTILRICIFAALVILTVTASKNQTFAEVPGSSPDKGKERENPAYDFSQLEVIASLGQLAVAEISDSQITFAVKEGTISDDIKYDRREDNFHVDGIYRVIYKGDEFFFRHGWQEFSDGKTIFTFVRWIGDRRPQSPDTMSFDAVKVPFIQYGTVRLTTVGASITWWLYGGYYREKLRKLDPSYRLVGSMTDICGYGHEGEGGDSTDAVIKRLDKITADSDHYILLIGTNDYGRNDAERTFKNIVAIVEKLNRKNDFCMVHVCTILPCDDRYVHKQSGKTRDRINSEVNNRLRSKYGTGDSERVSLVETDHAFRSKDNYFQFFPDGLHPNDAGYDILAAIIHEHIQGIMENH